MYIKYFWWCILSPQKRHNTVAQKTRAGSATHSSWRHPQRHDPAIPKPLHFHARRRPWAVTLHTSPAAAFSLLTSHPPRHTKSTCQPPTSLPQLPNDGPPQHPWLTTQHHDTATHPPACRPPPPPPLNDHRDLGTRAALGQRPASCPSCRRHPWPRSWARLGRCHDRHGPCQPRGHHPGPATAGS